MIKEIKIKVNGKVITRTLEAIEIKAPALKTAHNNALKPWAWTK
jgi:hypothetical protein